MAARSGVKLDRISTLRFRNLDYIKVNPELEKQNLQVNTEIA